MAALRFLAASNESLLSAMGLSLPVAALLVLLVAGWPAQADDGSVATVRILILSLSLSLSVSLSRSLFPLPYPPPPLSLSYELTLLPELRASTPLFYLAAPQSGWRPQQYLGVRTAQFSLFLEVIIAPCLPPASANDLLTIGPFSSYTPSSIFLHSHHHLSPAFHFFPLLPPFLKTPSAQHGYSV